MDYDVIEIAYRHHERIDGSGYPNKIDGEHLTLDQKILQVADVISALVAKRSYKEAWSIEKTIAILDENVNNNKYYEILFLSKEINYLPSDINVSRFRIDNFDKFKCTNRIRFNVIEITSVKNRMRKSER